MTRIINFIERLYNSIRYNGFYLVLALLFPYIIWKFDAGKEIIVSMAEEGFGLNIGLSILTFSALCLSVWCIPTLAIYLFQFILDWRLPAEGKEKNADNNKLRNCLFNQLINVYNGRDVSAGYCNPEFKIYRPQLPVRYFAMAPWILFIISCLQVFLNSTVMAAGLAVIITAIVVIDWKKRRVRAFFEWLLKKNRVTYSKETFIRRYAFLVVVYFLVIFLIIMVLKGSSNILLMKWLLCILNLFFLVILYSFMVYMENSQLEKYVDKEGKHSTNLAFSISNINYLVLLICLLAAIVIYYYLNQYQLIQYISPVVIIVTMCTSLIVFFELCFTSQLLLIRIVVQPGCIHNDCSLLACYELTGKTKINALKAYRFALIGLTIVIVNLYFFSSTNSHRIRTIAATKSEYISAAARPVLTDYFQQWFDSRHIAGDDSVVYLISGQGGGSRAAAWFFMNMADLKNRYPDFFKKVFSISTVSGSSTGANMFLASQYFNKSPDSAGIKTITAKLYGRNYMSSSFYGIMLGDFVESMLDMGRPFPRDRNYHLQKEELRAFNETFNIKNGADFFEKDYLVPYLDTTRHWPLFLINTTIVNFGTRAFFSPVQMDSISVARDLYGEFKQNACNAGDNLPLVTCVNQSQAFPVLSAYNYLDCIGRLGDGGISENSGCATTLEVYQKLRQYCDRGRMRQVKFICLNITNGSLESNFKVSYRKASIFNTATAAANSPFDGNETYAYRNLERQLQYLKNNNNHKNTEGSRNSDTVINCSLDKRITLTRTMSKLSVDTMFDRMAGRHFQLP